MKKISKVTAILFSAALVFGILFSARIPVQAAGLTISLSATSVNIGDSVTATVTVPSGYGATVSVSYDSSILEITSSAGNGGMMNLGDAMGYSSSGSITFKAKTAGSCVISATATSAGDAEANPVELSGASVTVTVANEAGAGTGTSGTGTGSAGTTATLSGDNSLSSLTLSAGTLSPAFSYSTTKYTATVDYSVTSIAISATPSNAKATVTSVTGNDNLAVGANTVKIVVQAENGVTATYTVTVTRNAQETAEDPGNEENPQPESTKTFTVNGVTLYPADTIPEEVIPEDFAEETIALEGVEYPCLSFSNGDLTLLYLMEADADAGQLYLYDSQRDAAYPFIRLKSEFGYVIVLLPGEQLIPENFSESSLSIEGKGYATAYQTPMQQSDFFLLYGMNQSGESGWYQYDTVEHTYQRYLLTEVAEEAQETVEELPEDDSEELEETYKQLQQKNALLLYISIGVIVVLLVTIGILIVTRGKSKKDETEEFDDEDGWDDEETDTEDEEAVEDAEVIVKEADDAEDAEVGAEEPDDEKMLLQENADHDDNDNERDQPEAEQNVIIPEEDSDDELEFIDL